MGKFQISIITRAELNDNVVHRSLRSHIVSEIRRGHGRSDSSQGLDNEHGFKGEMW